MTRTDEIKDRLSRGFYATDNLHAPSDIAYLLDAAEAAAWRGGAAAEAKEAEVARLKAERPGLVREGFRAGVKWWHDDGPRDKRHGALDEDATVARLTGEG